MLRCQHWTTHRCTNDAAGLLHAPDGKPVPGGYYCALHANATIREYREKLGEVWTLESPAGNDGLPFGVEPSDLLLPFCACGRAWSNCDGSRRGCRE